MVQKVKLVIRFLKRLPVQVCISLTLHLDQCPHNIKPTAAPTFRITQLIICHPNNHIIYLFFFFYMSDSADEHISQNPSVLSLQQCDRP